MATLKDAITNKVSKIQSDVQKTVNVLRDKLETSAEATKKGSTETPKISETPKVTSTPKATETTVTSNPTVTISKTPQTYGPTTPATTSDVKNLFGETKTKSPISMVESSLFKRGAEDKAIVPTSVVNSADAQGGTVKEAIDKTVFQQFSDWFNKPREDITKQTANLFVSHVDEEGIHLSKWLENLSMNSVNFINEAEFAIFKTIDVAANELGLYEPEEGLTKRFGNQFNYWENYGEERGEEALKKYESDTKAQDLKDRVSWEMLKLTEDEELSNTIGNVVGRVYSTASDPEEIAATVGYMLPGILATLASGGGFWAGTAVFAPSYATEAYQDLSKDKDITDNWGDTGVRSASAGIGILQAMVEEFGDAVGNMPWAKGFSKELRSIFTKNIKKDIVKGGEKIFMDEVEDIADKTIVKELRGGFKEILKNWFRGSVGEGVEEVVQDTILTEGAKSLGSKRDHMDLETALTDYFLGQVMGLEIMAPGVAVNFKKNQDLKEEYNKFSDNLDKVAPGINEETKMAFFSAMVTSQQNDANLSEKQISKYETQITNLYNQISNLENQLETTTDENTKTTIKEQIDGLNNQIKEIDKKINQWNNTKDEINKYIEEYNTKIEEEEAQKELEQLHADVNQSIEGENLQEQEMENLSEQTMRDTGIEYQTETPEFKNWFKDSKVVDKEGNPLVVYHGTRYNIKVPDMKKGKLQAYGGGMYFTTDKKGAEFYSKENKNLSSFFRKPRVMEVYLSIQNPIKEGEYKWDNKWIEELKNLGYEVDEKYLSNKKKDVYSKYTFLWMLQNKEKRADFTEDFSRVTGYDGLMVTQPGGEDYWIAFRPEQIKSATNNRGTFDSSNPDIRYSTYKVQQMSPINGWNKKDLRKSFENSVKQIISREKEYGDTEFAQYAYYNTATMVKDTREVMKMRAKVEDLLRNIGVRIRYTTNPKRDLGNSIGLYESGLKRVTYIADSKEVAIYGHEVLHAIMDVVFDGKITDEALQAKLQKTLRKAINDVKKQFGIDIYKQGTKEFDWANVFAEEWLANSFGEYLAKRELEGPKSFVQKIVDYFKDLIDLLFGTKYNASLNKNLREAFESIANGEVVKERKTFYSKALIGLRLGGKSEANVNPIESSTEITQDAMKESKPEEYAEMNKEDKLQSKQQTELGEHGKEIVNYEYTSLASALNQPSNTYLQDLSDDDLKLLHDNALNKWQSLMDNEEYGSPLIKATTSIVGKVNEEIARREKESAEKATKKSETEKTETKTKMKFKDAKDYVNKMIEIDKRNGVWSRSNDKFLRKAYMSDFLRTNLEGDFAAHLPGLKNVNLKQIKGKLTDKDIRDIAEMLSLVSTTLGIDFNKVIQDKDMSMNIVYNIKDFLYNTGALGLMSWKATKQMVKDLAERSGERFNVNFGADIAKMGVALTLEQGPMKSAATMAHELMHLIDFALSTEEGLPLYFEKGRVTYTSIIKGDNSWKTYTKGNYDKDYYNRWQEILARYAEQYFAYKNDKKLFDEFAKRNWYWTEEEFMKLIPKFESFIKNRLGAKLLDEQNQFYNDIVRRINENKFSTISTEFDKEGLREDEVKYKLEQLKEEYVWIMEHIDEMTGTLKEEMETYVQLSNIQTNYEMAKAKGEEYLEKLKTTPEQQGTIDGATTTVLPPEPEPGNTNPTPPQNPETIRLGLPYYGGSNIEEGVGDIAEGGDGPQLGNSYTKEEDIIKIRKRKNKIKNFRKELGQAWKDIFTPAISRIYNISPRVAGRLITMETQKDINIYRYREKAKGFVESLGKLKGNQALEVKKALLDYGALASEQGENIEEYKKEEVAKLREVLLKNGFKEEDINNMFYVLDDIGQQYKDAGLDVNLSDMYFPRVVKDYEGLIDYMNRVSGSDIKVNKISLMLRIKQIQQDQNLTEEQKEKKIRSVISMEFKQPGTTSQHGKERKIGKLSDWGEGIYAYYESPIESLDHYITTMVNAIQRQLFLGGLKEDANIDADIINQDTTESVSTIIGKLVEDGMINEEDVNELQKSILAVLNKKPSPKSVTALKDITYIATITNFLSAINQLDDLGMTILKDKSGLKHIVKTIFGKADIKYDDLGLEDSYEMFREEGGITNWLFKKSLFNFFDRLGKTSFVNAAWESLIHQSKNEKTRKYLYDRLVSMYGQESADRMMEKIDSGNYMGDDGQIDIEILRDLLYQLGSTQPLYTSAMPTTYLNHPWSRLCYALSSFTLKRIDWLVQGTKEVNSKHGAVAAGAWLMGVSVFLAVFGAAVGDVGDLLKGKKEETFLWQLINNGIEDALKSGGSDALNSWLKIWDLSDYDIKLYKQQGLWGVFSSKIKPFIFDLGKDVTEAITEHNEDEITDLAKYVPIFGKLVYYWCFEDIGKETKKSDWDFDMDADWDFGILTDTWDWEDDEEWNFS